MEDIKVKLEKLDPEYGDKLVLLPMPTVVRVKAEPTEVNQDESRFSIQALKIKSEPLDKDTPKETLPIPSTSDKTFESAVSIPISNEVHNNSSEEVLENISNKSNPSIKAGVKEINGTLKSSTKRNISNEDDRTTETSKRFRTDNQSCLRNEELESVNSNDKVSFFPRINIKKEFETNFELASNLKGKKKDLSNEVLKLCLKITEKLRVKESLTYFTRFKYTTTKKVQNIFEDKTNQSPLLRSDNVQFKFSSVSPNINYSSFGIHSPPDYVAHIAKLIGFETSELFDIFTSDKNSVYIKSEKIDKSFQAHASSQTDKFECDECISRNQRNKNRSFGTQTTITENERNSNSNDDIYPLSKIFNSLNINQQMAVKEFCTEICKPFQQAIFDRNVLRDKLLTVYDSAYSLVSAPVYIAAQQQMIVPNTFGTMYPTTAYVNPMAINQQQYMTQQQHAQQQQQQQHAQQQQQQQQQQPQQQQPQQQTYSQNPYFEQPMRNNDPRARRNPINYNRRPPPSNSSFNR